MKITVELPSSLVAEAKALAASQHTTLRELLIEGLRRVLQDRHARCGFELRRASYAGQGLHPDVVEGSWERIRDLIYEGRGA